MRKQWMAGIGFLLASGLAGAASAQEVIWRSSKASVAPSAVALGKPLPLSGPAAIEPPPPLPAADPAALKVVRGQAGNPPPPPAFPGGGGPAPYTPVAGDPYNSGVVNSDADLGFWSRIGQGFKRCWSDVSGGVGGVFQPGPNGKLFQSDHAFDNFASPVSNPFFFQDPRSLTQVMPVFIWQHTPTSNPVFNGGNNFVLAASGSVALTQNISFVFNRIGFDWIDPRGSSTTLAAHSGFSNILLGPKITFLRNETSNTVAAGGLTFDIPSGSSRVLQGTGHLGLIPYFSIAQAFGRSDYGTFNFMNTDGYAFRTDNTLSESLFASFHLDYDVANLHRFYPLIELNYRHYTRNGGANAFNFEGNDLGNFGSEFVSGHDELTLAIGARVKLNNYISFGLAAEFNTLNNSDGRHLDQFRLTTDMIFRY